MLKIWLPWFVSTLVGVAAGASVVVALAPYLAWPCAECSPALKGEPKHLSKLQPSSPARTILCFFSKATQQGDPIGYVRRDSCGEHQISVSPELDSLITLDDDGFLRVSDPTALQANFRHDGAILDSGLLLANVMVLRDVEPTMALTTCVNSLCHRWHQPTVGAIESIGNLEEILTEHWDEIDRCFPMQRQPERSLEENLSAIIERRACDVPGYVRDATVAAIASARSKVGTDTKRLRNETVAAIAEARSKLMFTYFDGQQEDLCRLFREYEKLQRTTPDAAERTRQFLLLYVKLEAKYPEGYFRPLLRNEVWAALRGWPEWGSERAAISESPAANAGR